VIPRSRGGISFDEGAASGFQLSTLSKSPPRGI
jgi:hypothetical protein